MSTVGSVSEGEHSPPALLEARGLVKSFLRGPEQVHALRGASLTLHPGEVVALAGPSGSGKSTLLNVLCGWEHPDEGEVEWPSSDREAEAQDRVWSELAIVPQRLGLVEELSVRENVALPLRLLHSRRDGGGERVDGLLRGLGLGALEERVPAEISIGEQQRTAMARALVLRPKLLLADEPTGHQDSEWARGVLRALRFSAKEGTCCLVATHNREAIRFADRVLAIRDGVVRPVDRAAIAG